MEFEEQRTTQEEESRSAGEADVAMAHWVGSLPEAGMSVPAARPCSCSHHLLKHPMSGGGVLVCFILFVFNVVSSGLTLLPDVTAVESRPQKFPPFSFSVFSPCPEAGSSH